MRAPEQGELLTQKLRSFGEIHADTGVSKATKRVILPLILWMVITAAVFSPCLAQSPSPIDSERTTNQTKTETSQTVITPDRLRLGVNSLWFTSAGLVLGIVVLSVIWRFSHPKSRYTDFFADGQFVQLVVIIMVAGNVCSLGIMGILEHSEIATIYAGIIGYILGKGVTPDKIGKPLSSDPMLAEATKDEKEPTLEKKTIGKQQDVGLP